MDLQEISFHTAVEGVRDSFSSRLLVMVRYTSLFFEVSSGQAHTTRNGPGIQGINGQQARK